MNTLLDFDNNDRLKNYRFESEWIKFFSPEEEKVFETKHLISIKRVPKKDKLVFLVDEEYEHKDNINSGGGREFKTEVEAINFFLELVALDKFFLEKNKENVVFDTRRYFLRINKNNEVIGRTI